MAQKWREPELPLFAEATWVNDPERALALLAAEARGCTRCPLYQNATQTVFGEGPADAPLMLVGEQPGDQEDLVGRPFIGPAGKVLDRALAAAGIDRDSVYITNAVKHFKNERRGKRRIHKKPDISEIDSCRWWLDHELAIVQPHVVVALGATAARALMRKALTINANRGRLIELPEHRRGVITVHPSYLLRLIEDRDKARESTVSSRICASLPRLRVMRGPSPRYTWAWEISATMIDEPHLISRNSPAAMLRLTARFSQWASRLFSMKLNRLIYHWSA
jgi:uracil-DNA glycosylase family protein